MIGHQVLYSFKTSLKRRVFTSYKMTISITWESLLNDIKILLSNKTALENGEIPQIIKRIAEYDSREEDWMVYTYFDPYKYTRNLVDSGNDYFNVLILCWAPGQFSPIHDHGGSHCVMKVLSGQLEETRYTIDEGKTVSKSATKVLRKNEITYINDSIGLHKVGNPSSNQNLISLHIYSPPIHHSKVFLKGKAISVGKSQLYSVLGKKLQ